MSANSLAGEEALKALPDMKISVRQVFGIDSDMEAPAFSQTDTHVPDVDPDYLFDRDTTRSLEDGGSHLRTLPRRTTLARA